MLALNYQVDAAQVFLERRRRTLVVHGSEPIAVLLAEGPVALDNGLPLHGRAVVVQGRLERLANAVLRVGDDGKSGRAHIEHLARFRVLPELRLDVRRVAGHAVALTTLGRDRVSGGLEIEVDLSASAADLPWLQYDWPSDGLDSVYDDNPVGRATFGIYSGHNQRIFTRELY